MKLSPLIALLLAFAAFAAGAHNPEPCEAPSDKQTLTKSFNTSDPELAILDKIASLVRRLPRIRDVKIEGDGSAKITKAWECCPDAEDPTQYDEFEGSLGAKISGKFTVVGGRVSAIKSYEAPWWLGGWSVMAVLGAGAGVDADLEISLAGSITGHVGECNNCMTVTAGGSGTLTGRAFLEGKVDVSVDPGGRLAIEVTGSGTISAGASSNATYKFLGCDGFDATACLDPVTTTLSAEISLPFGLNWSYSKEWELTDKLCL